MKLRLRIMIGLWIGVLILGSCEERADYLNWSRKVANYCKYVKFSEESKRYECGPKLGEFYTYIIIHPDYDLPKNPIYPLVAYDGNDNVVMVGGNGKGQIWRMIKFEIWAFVRETKTGMKEVYYDKEEKAFIGLEMGDNKENIKSMAWWSRDGGKSWVRAKVPGFNKKEGNKTNSVLSVPPVVELTPKVAPKTPVLKPLAPTPVGGPIPPKAPVAPAGPKLPVGGVAEVVGGGYAVAIGKVGGKPAVWRSDDKVPRNWKETNRFKGVGRLPDSLSRPSDLTKVDFVSGKFEITDTEGKGWTYEDTKNEWELTDSGGFEGGSGTVADPYEIASASHLWLAREKLDKNFKLTQDLDLSVVTEPEGFAPIGDGTGGTPFTGTFDGNGKKIRKLRIDLSSKNDYTALFEWVGDGGVVKNIGLEDVDVTGKDTVGGITGFSSTNATIENIYVTGNIRGEENVGGLVGTNNGTIRKSYVMGTVRGRSSVGGLVGFFTDGVIETSYAMGAVTAIDDYVGGLVGNIFKGEIKNSYATGNVEGRDVVGGLVGGGSGGKAEKSYATGTVTGTGVKIGGFIGYKDTSFTIPAGPTDGKNYWQTGSAAQGVGQGSKGSVANVIEQTDAELKALDAATTGWDGTTIWEFTAGEYPKLR